MPAKDFTARFRTDSKAWERLGERIGKRNRSADLDAYLAWRLAHPDAELPADTQAPERVHDIFVRVRIGPNGPSVEVVELPTGHGRDDATRAEIDQAIDGALAAAMASRSTPASADVTGAGSCNGSIG